MRKFRFRKQTDGSVHLNMVHPPASGLSTAPETEETVLTMTAEEYGAVEELGPLDPATSDTSKAEGLSNAAAPVPAEPPPAPATTVDLAVLDENVDDVVAAIADLPEADLVALRAAEVDGKDRKGVLAAIDARVDALKG